MNMKPKRIKEIARITKLSTATISRALTDGTAKKVSQKTREKIYGTINRLGYIPNRMARALRTKRSNTIGFLMNFETDNVNGYIQEILNGAFSALKKAKFDLKIIFFLTLIFIK